VAATGESAPRHPVLAGFRIRSGTPIDRYYLHDFLDHQVESHRNCLVAVAAMLGLAIEELTPAELNVNRSRWPVLITLTCVKSRAAHQILGCQTH
jgi:hypothetical protein